MVQVDDRFCSVCSICLSEHNPALNDRTSLLQEYRSALYHLLSYSQHLTPRRTCTKRYAFKLFPERNLFFGAKIADAFPNVTFTTDQCCTQQRSQSCCNAVLSYVAFQSNVLGTKMSWHMWI